MGDKKPSFIEKMLTNLVVNNVKKFFDSLDLDHNGQKDGDQVVENIQLIVSHLSQSLKHVRIAQLVQGAQQVSAGLKLILSAFDTEELKAALSAVKEPLKALLMLGQAAIGKVTIAKLAEAELAAGAENIETA